MEVIMSRRKSCHNEGCMAYMCASMLVQGDKEGGGARCHAKKPSI